MAKHAGKKFCLLGCGPRENRIILDDSILLFKGSCLYLAKGHIELKDIDQESFIFTERNCSYRSVIEYYLADGKTRGRQLTPTNTSTTANAGKELNKLPPMAYRQFFENAA